MGLYKQIMSDDGVPVNYHRVSSVNIITNQENLVEVKSYVDGRFRQEELTMLASGEFDPGRVYVQTRWHSHPYDPAMTVEGAYEWLKSAEFILNAENQFLGAEDAMDEWDVPEPVEEAAYTYGKTVMEDRYIPQIIPPEPEGGESE